MAARSTTSASVTALITSANAPFRDGLPEIVLVARWLERQAAYDLRCLFSCVSNTQVNKWPGHRPRQRRPWRSSFPVSAADIAETVFLHGQPGGGRGSTEPLVLMVKGDGKVPARPAPPSSQAVLKSGCLPVVG